MSSWPEFAGETVDMTSAPTMEEPWPLRVMLKHFQDWVGKLGQAWVAGEISKIRSAGSQTFFTLRSRTVT